MPPISWCATPRYATILYIALLPLLLSLVLTNTSEQIRDALIILRVVIGPFA